MTNETLKNALKQAGMTPEEFATVIQVDPKSVQRWLAGTTTPYPRHRAKISRALALPEDQLWPELSPQAASDSLNPVEFVADTTGDIDLLDNGYGIDLGPSLIDALLEQAQAGRQIRLLTHQPTADLMLLADHQHIHIRALDANTPHSLLRAGDLILLALHLVGAADEAAPLLKLTRDNDADLFGRLVDDFELLWQAADQRPSELEHIEHKAAGTNHAATGKRAAPRPAEPVTSMGHVAAGPAPRRWPGRPD